MTCLNFNSHISWNNTKRLFFSFIITSLFIIIEIIGGFISGSLALLADASHMLIDAVALFFAILAIKFANRLPKNMHHTFGWLRITTLTAFINAVALIVITLFIFWKAIYRFYDPHPITKIVMMIISIIGFAVNVLAFWILHYSNEKKDLNIRMAAMHILGDLMGSAGTIIAALIIMWTGWIPIDSILSILISCLILYNTWQPLKESINELLEGAPISTDIVSLKHNITSAIPEINNIHHIHIWQIGEKQLITMHVQAIHPQDHDALLNRIQHFIKNQYQITHITIQMEYQPCNNALTCCL